MFSQVSRVSKQTVRLVVVFAGDLEFMVRIYIPFVCRHTLCVHKIFRFKKKPAKPESEDFRRRRAHGAKEVN
jgi:hypothetical protein